MPIFKTADTADTLLIQQLAHKIWHAHYPDIVSVEQIGYMLEAGYTPASLQRQMEEGQAFRLVFLGETPIGFISISRQAPGRYFLNKFYLDQPEQGKGIGSAVLSLLISQYPDLEELRLFVNRRNYKSINFYFKNGFFIEKWVDTPLGPGYLLDDFQMLYRKR